VIRLALSPTFFDLDLPLILSVIFFAPLLSVFDSATSTSPFGVTYIHLGFCKLSAYFVTVKPAGAMGVLSAGHPITLLKFLTDLVAYGKGNESFSTVP
jgi:hypothetical protein